MAEPDRGVWGLAFRHDLRLVRRGAIAWAGVFSLSAVSIVKGYTSAYPTLASRVAVATLLEGNRAFEALYGLGHRLGTLGGFVVWRISALGIVGGIWGLLAATRVLRGEEEAGCWELVVSGAVTTAGATTAAFTALAVGFVVAGAVFAATLVGLGLAGGSSVLYAAEIIGAAMMFGAVGAVASQLVPIRRRASALAGIVLGGALLVRIVADGTGSLGWLRAFTPFGWMENLRPFAGSNVVWLTPIVVSTVVLGAVALRIAAARDLGAGALWSGDTGRSSTRLLGSELRFAIRRTVMPTGVWTVSMATFGAVMGLLAVDIVKFAGASPGMRRIADRIGAIDIGTPKGYLGLASVVLIVPVCLFVGFRLQASREEEATGRLEGVLSRAVGRRGWLLSQVGVAAAGASVLAMGIALAAWVGAVSRGAHVGITSMLVAGGNWMPATLLFLGIGVLAFAIVPRLAPQITLGGVAVGFLIQLIGSVAKMPRWVLDLSPFHHVAASPAGRGERRRGGRDARDRRHLRAVWDGSLRATRPAGA